MIHVAAHTWIVGASSQPCELAVTLTLLFLLMSTLLHCWRADFKNLTTIWHSYLWVFAFQGSLCYLISQIDHFAVAETDQSEINFATDSRYEDTAHMCHRHRFLFRNVLEARERQCWSIIISRWRPHPSGFLVR
jgi:hypothetical protein